MGSLNFIFGVHNHQPVGNFDTVFEHAYQRAYLPFMQIHAQFSQLKIVQHYTGVLIEWIEAHHPEFVRRLKKSSGSGQIEMMTGGYYEPILMTIPDEDKKKPKGPHLVKG